LGESFLKQHHSYKNQHKKFPRNQAIVWSWILPGTDDFVDSFLSSLSLHWNLDFLKKLRKYICEMRKSGDIDEKIVDINFPDDGIKLCWRGIDILKYVLEIKHYRKSSKSNPRGGRLIVGEIGEERLTIMPVVASEEETT